MADQNLDVELVEALEVCLADSVEEVGLTDDGGDFITA